ncbi:MAG: AEC family transporter [Rhodospirillales bacterium]|jgi:malonate transporter and related proteins|nr:AEC family transporter [Rhodospirillales bacterium]
MFDIVLSLAPIFALIMLGYALKHLAWVPEDFWASAERMTYYIFFPALLISNTAKADLAGVDIGTLALALVIPLFFVSAASVLTRGLTKSDGPSFTSVFQGNIRPNTYVGIAAAFALFGDPGLTLTAVAIVLCVPTVNVFSVFALVRYASPPGTSFRLRQTVLPVLRNPLIISSLIGAAWNAGDIGSPPVVGPLLEILGRAALPVGLMAVGAGLDIAAVRPVGRLVVLAVTTKLAVLPALTFLASWFFGLDALATGVCVSYAALPTSISSYVLARQMGGNSELMAGIVTATTLVAMATIPLAISLLN